MLKSVATEGDVEATPGALPVSPAVDGQWEKVGSVDYQTDSLLTINGTGVIFQAQCTFNFTNPKDGNGNPVLPTPDMTQQVVLVPNETKLTSGLAHLLVNGDKIEDRFGNKLEVKTGNILKIS